MNFIGKMSQRINCWFTANAPDVPPANSGVELQTLEDRVLYSAAPVPVELFVDAPTVDSQFENVDQQLDFLTESVEQLQTESTDPNTYQFSPDEESFESSDAIPVDLPNLNAQELILIDGGVEDHAALLNDILENRDPNLVSVQFIDPNVDGVEEISRILAEASANGQTFDAIHIVSHGDAGEVQLGNTTLDNTPLSQYSDDIASWQQGLSEHADILFYGCDLAATEDGMSLVDSISLLSGADVAASDDITGHENQAGDWEFEYAAGIVDFDAVFSATLQESWDHSLQTTLGDASGTSLRSIGVDFNGNQTIASSTTDAEGNWIVQVSRYSGADSDVPLQLFDGSDFENFQVNDTEFPSGGQHRHAVVGSDAVGNFVVAWEWSNDAGDETRIFAKIFDPAGNVIRDQFQVDDPGSNGTNATISVNSSGQFVVGWQEPHDMDHNHARFTKFDIQGNIQDDTFIQDIEPGFENVVVSINNLGHVAVGYSTSDGSFGARVVINGLESEEFLFSEFGIESIDDLSIDINDQGMIGVAFVAEAGFGGAENADIYSVILQHNENSNELENLSPDLEFPFGFGSIDIPVFRHSGFDAGLEFAPSIALENGRGLFDLTTTFYVTWHGQGSWQSNLDAGTVVDIDGNPVSDVSSFPTGSVVADNGVFIAETTLFQTCLLYTSPSPRDQRGSRMPSSA